jgi:hypothetical protein
MQRRLWIAWQSEMVECHRGFELLIRPPLEAVEQEDWGHFQQHTAERLAEIGSSPMVATSRSCSSWAFLLSFNAC